MNEEIASAIERGVADLRRELATFGTADLVAWCKWPLADIGGQTGDGLVSPYRQLVFTMSLLLETPEPAVPTSIMPPQWIGLCRSLNWLFLQYGPAFEPSRDASGKMDVAAFEQSLVAGTSYLHYFNTGRIAHDTQLLRWYEGTLCAFDAELSVALGVSATELLAIFQFLGDAISSVDEAMWRRRMIKFARLTNATGAITASKFAIERGQLRDRFGAPLSDAFWSRFVVKRGGVTASTKYPTDPDHLEVAPLIEIDNDTALFTHPGAILEAITQRCANELLGGAHANRYRKRRDDFLEAEVRRIFQEFFGTSACVYSPAFLDEFEHDVLIVSGRRVLIVEAKAGALKEPFRDVLRSFPRLKQNFDRVIQEGFAQGNRTRSRLVNGEQLQFRNRDGDVILTLNGATIDEISLICVTADDFGPLAIDLSLLLDKRSDEPFPWAVNFFDVDTFLAAFVPLDVRPEALFTFLRDRRPLHGRIICDDELELAGFFLQGGSLTEFDAGPGTKTIVPDEGAEIFDNLFFDDAIDEAEDGS